MDSATVQETGQKMNQIKWKTPIIKSIEDHNKSTRLVTDLKVSQTDIKKRMEYYFSIPQPPQKSQAWLNQRTNYITASALEDALCPRWTSKRNDLLKNKVSRGKYRTFFGNEATRWGEKYEDVANAVYCYRQKTEVEEFGLLPHTRPDLYFLGASTDGISKGLINLEIKCPFSRRIIPGTVPHHYWKQTQLQMEVLDLPVTHFLECKFREYATAEDFWIDFDYPSANPEKGIIVEYVDLEIMNNEGEPKTMYHYSPVGLSEQDLRLWEKEDIHQLVGSGNKKIYIRSHYWVLDVCSCVNIARDKAWFDGQIPSLKEFWREVEYYRGLGDENGKGFEQLCQDVEANSRKTIVRTTVDEMDLRKPAVCIIDSSDEEDIPADHESKDIHKKAKDCFIISSSESELSDSESSLSSFSDTDSENEVTMPPEADIMAEEGHFPVHATHGQIRKYLHPDGSQSSEGEFYLTHKSKNKSTADDPKQDLKIATPKKKTVPKKFRIKKKEMSSDHEKSSPGLNKSNKKPDKTKQKVKPILKISPKSISEPPLMLESLDWNHTNATIPMVDQGQPDEFTLPLSKENLQKYSRRSLVLTSSEKSNSVNDYFSSGSDTEEDSLPIRPPARVIYYRRKKKK